MVTALCKSLAACCLALAATNAAGQCSLTDRELEDRSARDLERYVRERFAEADFACGIRAVEVQSKRARMQQSADGEDSRFALRNLAVKLNQDATYPAEKRLALIRAAVFEPATSHDAGISEEQRFNVLMLIKAGEQYVREKDAGARLESLKLAIRLDLRLPESTRVIKPWTITTVIPDSTQTYKYLRQLANLAEMTKDDRPSAGFRARLAHTVRFYGSAFREGDPASEVAERAEQLLRLAEALKDVRECYGCVPEWHWTPVMAAGTAYYRIGMETDGVKTIRRAIEMARAIKNPNYRLSEYRFVLTELWAAKYDRKEIISLVAEMQALADYLDTPIAKELRESLPKTIKRWGLDRIQ